MKFICSCLLLITASSYAESFNISKGDFAIYEKTQYQAPHVIKKVVTNLKRGINGDFISAQLAKYLIKSDNTERRLGVENVLYPFLKEKYIDNIETECEKLNGDLEEIQTHIGKIETCKVVSEIAGVYSISTWLAEYVPFGIVKESVRNSSDPDSAYTIELIQFGLGSKVQVQTN